MKYKTFIRKILFLFTITIYSFSFSAVFAQSTNALLTKAGRELYQKIESLDDNEKIDIFIWKTSINDEEYKEELLRLGFDEDIYGNEDIFQSEIASKLQEANQIDKIKEIRKGYKIARLQAIKNMTIASNNKFIYDYDIDFDDVIYFSSYTSTVIISITKEKVHLIISDQRILGISLYEDIQINNQLIISVDQVNAGYGTVQNPGGTVFSSSTSSTNIFEMLEYTIPADQDILLRVNRAAYISSSLYISISCFWMGV